MEMTEIDGTVKHFKGNGRQLGYPTANIDTPVDLADGVYFGFADLREFVRQPALVFVGVPTTVGDTVRRVEAHLLDIPDNDYYGEKLKLSIQHYHRPNQTFDTMSELLSVMAEDEKAGRAWFSGHDLSRGDA
jgi:riboflavin kinase/FMN adenylyltransferase